MLSFPSKYDSNILIHTHTIKPLRREWTINLNHLLTFRGKIIYLVYHKQNRNIMIGKCTSRIVVGCP